MNEFMTYVAILKTAADRIYGKEVVFYDGGEWYSREHGRYITPEELAEFVIGLFTELQTELAEKEALDDAGK